MSLEGLPTHADLMQAVLAPFHDATMVGQSPEIPDWCEKLAYGVAAAINYNNGEIKRALAAAGLIRP